ncbi:Structural maintenance of chromosomes protein 3 [Mitosporidium daphniae]
MVPERAISLQVRNGILTSAIRFVLNDAYARLGAEERLALIHDAEAAGTDATAWVEILFENSDLRIPTGKTEVAIKRTLTRQADHFSVDGRVLTRGELNSLLQAAGFSQSNPFYIVPQGRITALTNARDEERLALLKEIAGMTTYEGHRAEASKILCESDSRIAKIREMLTAISERHEELSEEQRKLISMERADEERRALEYTLLTREQAEVQSALEAQGDFPAAESSSSTFRELEERAGRAQEARATLTQATEMLQTMLRQQHTIVRERRAALADGDTTTMSAPDAASQSYSISTPDTHDILHPTNTSTHVISRLEEEKAALEARAEIMGRELSVYTARLEHYVEQEADLEMRIAQIQSRSPKMLAALKIELENTIAAKSSLLAERIRHQEQQAQLTAALNNQEQKVIPEAQTSLQATKARAAQLATARRALWQEETKNRAVLPALQEEMLSVERELFATAPDRAISLGLSSLRRILADHDSKSQKENQTSSLEHKSVAAGILGPLYELISVADPVYDAAVEAVAGAQLFHVVVENDDVAAALVSALASRNAGRLTFVPLSAISETTTHVLPADDYSVADNILPMTNIVSARDARIEPVLRSIFGNTAIVESLDEDGPAGMTRPPTHSLVTLEGDRRDRRGAITGGYVDTRRSRLALVRRITALRDQKIAPILATLSSIEERSEKIDREAAQAAGSIAQLEVALQRYHIAAERLRAELTTGQRFADERFDADADSLQNELALLRVRLANLQKDTDLDLSQATGGQLDTNSSQNRVLADHMEEKLLALRLGGERETLRQQVERLRAELIVRVQGRLEAIVNRELPAAKSAAALLEASRAQQATWREQSEALLAEAEQGYVAMKAEFERVSAALEQAVVEQEAAEMSLEAFRMKHAHDSAATTRLHSQRSTWTMRLQEIDRRIRELGHIPAAQLEALRSERTQLLRARLCSTSNPQLGIGAIVGRRTAGEQQLAAMAKQRITLQERERELTASATAIQSYIATLDCQKDAVVLRTFESLAAAFAEIFAEIVPGGSASLILTRRFFEQDENVPTTNPSVGPSETSLKANGLQNDPKRNFLALAAEAAVHESTLLSATQAAEWTGISVKASFAPGASSLSTGLLSGGQKSVIACALIFAIQRCDPAPFYIFDEIDANLDAPHRTAIASMISRLSLPPSSTTAGSSAVGAQFLVTTFRPELAVHADRFFGISLLSRVSRIREIQREEALDFIVRDAE